MVIVVSLLASGVVVITLKADLVVPMAVDVEAREE